MIHFLPETFTAEPPQPEDDAAARVASIRAGLAAVERMAGTDAPLPDAVTAWPKAGTARQRCFERRSVESAQAAAAGLEVLASQAGGAHPQAVGRLAEALRGELSELGRLFSL